MDFNASITYAMAKTMEHLIDFLFVTVANNTLVRRDSYLSHNQLDALAALRTAPLYIHTLFSGKQNRTLLTLRERVNFTQERNVASIPMNVQTNRQITENQTDQPGSILGIVDKERNLRARPLTIHHNQPRGSSPINDNYCVKILQTGLLPGSKLPTPRKTMNSLTHVNSLVVNPVLNAPGLSQKKDTSPGVSGCSQEVKLKYVKDVFCVDQLSFVKPVTNSQLLPQICL